MNSSRTADRFRYLGEVQGPDSLGVIVLPKFVLLAASSGISCLGCVVSHRCLTVSLSVHSGLVDMCLETGLARSYRDMLHRVWVSIWMQGTYYCKAGTTARLSGGLKRPVLLLQQWTLRVPVIPDDVVRSCIENRNGTFWSTSRNLPRMSPAGCVVNVFRS